MAAVWAGPCAPLCDVAWPEYDQLRCDCCWCRLTRRKKRTQSGRPSQDGLRGAVRLHLMAQYMTIDRQDGMLAGAPTDSDAYTRAVWLIDRQDGMLAGAQAGGSRVHDGVMGGVDCQTTTFGRCSRLMEWRYNTLYKLPKIS